MNKPKVLIAVPNGDGWIHKLVTFSVIKLLQDSRANSKLILPTHKPIVENRHRIIKDFLKEDYDFLIMIDSDNPPKNNVIDLIFLNLDIIGCPTPVWANMKVGDYPMYWNAMYRVEGGYKPVSFGDRENGIVEVDAVGSGCIIIARRVLERMGCEPFIEVLKDGLRDEGSDFGFCRRAKEAGFQVYTHLGYPCMHFNELELTEVMLAFWEYHKNKK